MIEMGVFPCKQELKQSQNVPHTNQYKDHLQPSQISSTAFFFFFTFQAAYPPQSRVGECPRILLILVVGVILGDVGCAVADEGTGIQPVVRPYCHRHQAEGSECPHGGEKDLDPLLTHHAFRRRADSGTLGLWDGSLKKQPHRSVFANRCS